MMTPDDITLFDRYLMGELNLDEKKAFEQSINDSDIYKETFESYKSFSKEIENGAEYKAITKELNHIHNELYLKPKPFFFSPKFLIPLGIAASIVFLFFVTPFNSSLSENTISNYKELANSSDHVYKSNEELEGMDPNDSITTNYPPLKDSLAPIETIPLGTAFLIDPSGYFFTSKHLIAEERVIILQQKTRQITFETEVVYTDSILDFAILKCTEKTASQFTNIPFHFTKTSPELGSEVFALGYPKKDIVYLKGAVSSETGFDSDTLYYEISMPSNGGLSGAPLFNENGQISGIITAKNINQQAVTYVLKPDFILDCVLRNNKTMPLTISSAASKKQLPARKYIKKFRSYIFEVH